MYPTPNDKASTTHLGAERAVLCAAALGEAAADYEAGAVQRRLQGRERPGAVLRSFCAANSGRAAEDSGVAPLAHLRGAAEVPAFPREVPLPVPADARAAAVQRGYFVKGARVSKTCF